MEKLLTEREAADLLGQSPRTLQQWRWRHIGPDYVKNGRSVRYRSSDIQKFIDQNAVDISGASGANK